MLPYFASPRPALCPRLRFREYTERDLTITVLGCRQPSNPSDACSLSVEQCDRSICVRLLLDPLLVHEITSLQQPTAFAHQPSWSSFRPQRLPPACGQCPWIHTEGTPVSRDS